MATLIELTDAFKKSALIDDRLRYRRQHYEPVRRLLRELDTMDRDARRALSERLTGRTLEWAARLPGGLPQSVPLAQRPMIAKGDVRARPERFCTRASIRIPSATSGKTGIPVRLVRSLANIGAEQAFIDALLGVWNYTFRDARMARLQADNVRPAACGRSRRRDGAAAVGQDAVRDPAVRSVRDVKLPSVPRRPRYSGFGSDRLDLVPIVLLPSRLLEL